MNKIEKCSTTQKGRIVIHKGEEEKRIYSDDLDVYLADGWERGYSKKHKTVLSLKAKGRTSPTKGKSLSEETKEKISKTLLSKNPEAWNKGLTKETDDRVKRGAEKQKGKPGSNKGKKFSLEHKDKIGAANKGKPSKYKGIPRSDETKRKISNANRGHITSEEAKEKIRLKHKGYKLSEEKLKMKLSKEYITKKKNKSFNTSKAEENFYEYLLKENVNKTIYRNYKDSARYQFYCDFYIEEDDLFIELNAHWTHGGRPYDESDEECQKQLLEWKEKAKTSQFYANAIETWTVRDVQKQKIAKENNLNYKVIY